MSVLIKGMDMPKEGKIIVIYKLNGQFYASMNGTELCPLVEVPTTHGRLIDADAFAKTVKDISIRQRYDKLTFDNLTVDDVLDSVIVELNGSGLDGYKNAPTVIEAEK